MKKHNALTAERVRGVPPAMIQDLATGVEEPIDIARRYGYTDQEWDELKDDKWLNREVNFAIAERSKSGKTFTTKAKLMSEMLLENVYECALGDNVPAKDKAAVLTVLAKLGNLEPEKKQQTEAGPGFSITITVPEYREEETAKAEEVEKPQEDVVIDIPFKEK